MVHIQIVIDGEESVVVQKEMASDNIHDKLREIVARWKIQADEPCSIGKKCGILNNWIREIEEVCNAC